MPSARPTRPFRLVMVLLATIAMSIAGAGALWAHGALRSSSPADGDHLAEAPRELRLTFTESPDLGGTRVTLTGPAGAVALAPLRVGPGAPMTVVAEITGLLTAGPHTVAWQVTGADGHPVRGTFEFTIAPGAAGLRQPDPDRDSTPARAAPSHHDPVAMPTGGAFDSESPAYVAARWLLYAGLLIVVGAAAFGIVVLNLLRRRPGVPPEQLERSRRRAAHVGTGGAAVLLVASAARLVAQSAALHGVGLAADPGLIGSMLRSTSWGTAWIILVAAGFVALVAFRLAARGGPGAVFPWGVAAAAAATASFMPAFASHAAASPQLRNLAVAMDGLHVVGAAGWLGSLFVVVVAGIPAAMELGPERRGKGVADLLASFSPTALLFAATVSATGLFAAWLHVGTFGALWGSTYGRFVLLKVAVLSIVALTGAYNWLRVLPTLGGDAGTVRIRRSATVELSVAIVVLLVTAILVATPTPMDL